MGDDLREAMDDVIWPYVQSAPDVKALRNDLVALLQERGLCIVPIKPTEMMLTHGHASGVRREMLWERITYNDAHTLRMAYLPTAWRVMIEKRPGAPEADDG